MAAIRWLDESKGQQSLRMTAGSWIYPIDLVAYYLRRFEGSLGSLVYLTITRLFHTEEVYNDIQIPASFNSHVYTIETEVNRKL